MTVLNALVSIVFSSLLMSPVAEAQTTRERASSRRARFYTRVQCQGERGATIRGKLVVLEPWVSPLERECQEVLERAQRQGLVGADPLAPAADPQDPINPLNPTGNSQRGYAGASIPKEEIEKCQGELRQARANPTQRNQIQGDLEIHAAGGSAFDVQGTFEMNGFYFEDHGIDRYRMTPALELRLRSVTLLQGRDAMPSTIRLSRGDGLPISFECSLSKFQDENLTQPLRRRRRFLFF